MIRILSLLGLMVAATPAFANQIEDGAAAIQLHLIKADRWVAVMCSTTKVGNGNFVFCHPAGDASFGGLFAVSVSGKGKPVVHPVNGKAKQYLKAKQIEAMDGSPVEVRPWDGDPNSVGAILAAVDK